jgi:hypothetical protein
MVNLESDSILRVVPNSECPKRVVADRCPSVEFERNEKPGFQTLRFLDLKALLVC